MGLDDDSTASVRIEYGDLQSGRGLAPIEPAGSNNGASGKRALVVVAVALLAVAGVVYALAPNSGTTALGTPITTTTVAPSTSVAPSTTASGDDAVAEESSVDRSERVVDPLDGFASAESLFLAFNVVPAEVGWFAHGFSNDEQEGGLYRSPDGLNWNQLPLDDLPDGSVVGFERLSGGYVLALDESNMWNGDGPGDALEGYRISFWVSPDAATWTLDPDRETLDGVGFPYPVKMSDVATAVPSVGPATEASKALLIEYLAPALSAELAVQICSAVRRTTDEGDVIAFADCDAQIVVELGEDEAPELFALDNPGVEECVSGLGGLGAQSSQVQILGPDGSNEIVDLGSQFSLFGELFEETFLSLSPTDFSAQVLPGCLADFDSETVEDGRGLRRIVGLSIDSITLPERAAESFLLGVAGAPDGRAFIAGASSVMAASAPFDDWETLAIGRSNGEESPEFENGISVATDGSIFLGFDGATWFLARPDDTEWIEVEVGPRNFGTVLLAGDDFAIVDVGAFDGPNSTLVKVPLS